MLKTKSVEIDSMRKEEDLIGYADRLAKKYRATYKAEERKKKGQFFTPKSVSQFMAKLAYTEKETIKLLDPGAGIGTLTAAFCQQIISSDAPSKSIRLDAYENDPKILPFLEKVLETCKKELNQKGYEAEYRIYNEDFVMKNMPYLKVSKKSPSNQYDVVISNPPYYKLSKNSPQAEAAHKLIYSQPNIYILFMTVSSSMLREGGLLVFITPRSFCSGLYYKKFRKWLMNNLILKRIHLFGSRKNIFKEDEILQETLILKGVKSGTPTKDNLTISSSEDRSFSDLNSLTVQFSDVCPKIGKETFIRLSTSHSELQIIHTVDSWAETLKSLGLQISTGPVVPFRSKSNLKNKTRGPGLAPLLWMHNLQNMGVEWPTENTKPQSISINEDTKKLLVPVSNYVLIKRFSSKEQKYRLYSGVLNESDFKGHKLVGIENHLNYIHRPRGVLAKKEAYGLSAILNTAFIDTYFRSLSGHTQVNAAEIRSLPLPKKRQIWEIGKLFLKGRPRIGYELDYLVKDVLNLEPHLLEKIYSERHE